MIAGDKLIAAHKAYKAKDYETAISEAKAALELDPMAHKAYQIISTASRDRGDWAGALAAIERALGIAPRDAECLNSYGNILVPLSRDFDAIEAYKTSLDIAPNYIQPAIGLGSVYLSRKNPIAAADVFQSALTHSPDHPTLLKGLLFALKDAQQFDIATDLLNKMPPSPETALAAGQIAIARRQKPVAEANFVRALSHPPSAVSAFRNLVQMRWTDKAGGQDGAAQLIDTFVTDNPDAGPFYLYGAELLSEMGRFGAALDLISRAEAKFGDIPDTQFVKAKILIDEGRGADGFENANKALQARPGDLSIMAQFTRGALMTGQAALALEAAKAAQVRQPKNQFWVAAEATALRALGREEEYKRLYNYDFVKAYDLMPPPEYDTQAEFLGKLKAALMKRHTHQAYPLGQSLRGGTQTSTDLRFASDRVIQDFFQALAAPINDYIASMPSDSTHPLFARRRKAYRLTGAWSVHLQGEGFHVNHVHPEGWISSAFYVDVPKDTAERKDKAGWIAFGKPPFAVPGPDGKPLGAAHMVAPAAGRLVLFPSYMWHGTVPLPEGETSRLTLPFDAVPG